MRPVLLALALCALLAPATRLEAGFDTVEFNPDLETSFDPLTAGDVADMTQAFTFHGGEEAPGAIAVEIDRGSFDFESVEVDDVVGALTFEMTVTDPTGREIEGVVEADVTVTAVGEDGDEIDVDMVVASVNDALLDFFEAIGEDDPTGAVYYSSTLVDLADDDGVRIDPIAPGEFAFTGTLAADLDMTFELDGLYVHTPDGGEVSITTTIEGALGLEAEISETIKIESPPDDAPTFFRGDFNGDGTVSGIPDGLFLLRWQFQDGEDPPCFEAADYDNSGEVSGLADGLGLLKWWFNADGGVPAPDGDTCQSDPDEDDAGLGCEQSTCTP